jgi:hypothetical protein
MAEVTKSANVSLASLLPPPSQQLTGQTAGEALGRFDALVLRADGKWYRASGAANDANAVVDGWSADVYAAGDKRVTVWFGDMEVYFADSGLVPGAPHYLSGAVPGGLSTTTSVGGLNRIAFAIDTQRVRLLPPR